MPRTQSAWHADLPHVDGHIHVAAPDLAVDSANLVLTRNAAFDWSLNRTAGGAETYNVVATLRKLFRTGEFPDLQEQFGGTKGPSGVPGRPPYAGAAQLVPPSAPVPKGIKLLDFYIAYQVGVASLTSVALAVDKVVYANATALAKTSIALAATPAFTLVAAATPYLIKRAVTTPVFITDDNSVVQVEATFVMANTGTLRVYAIGAHVSFNYN